MPRTKEAFEAMREVTRQKIEAAALSLFARKGLSVTVGEIAEAAGVSKGLLYNHYPSKGALIAELIRQAAQISAGTIKDFSESNLSAGEIIRQISFMMCEMLTTSYHGGIEFFMFMIQAGMSGFRLEQPLYDEKNPDPNVAFANVIAAGQREGTVVDGDPVQLNMIFWAAIQGLCCYVMTGMELPITPKVLSRILLKEKY